MKTIAELNLIFEKDDPLEFSDKSLYFSAIQKDVMSRKEVRDKISKAHVGKKDDLATKAKKSATHIGLKRTKEHAQAISDSLHGPRNPLTEEHKKKLSDISKGIPKFYKRNVLTSKEKKAYKKAIEHGPVLYGTRLVWAPVAKMFNLKVAKLQMYAEGKRLEDLV